MADDENFDLAELPVLNDDDLVTLVWEWSHYLRVQYIRSGG